MSSFNTAGTNTFSPTAAPPLLAMGMAMVMAPAAFAAEDTVIVEGDDRADAVNREEQDWRVKTTAAGNKMHTFQRCPAVGQYCQPTAAKDQQQNQRGDDQYAGDQREAVLTRSHQLLPRGFEIDNLYG